MAYTKFVIVAQPRTGSSYLNTLLNSHQNIRSYGELFHPLEKVRRRTARAAKAESVSPDDDPVEYLRSCIFKEYPAQVKAVGFKLFYKHARNSAWKGIRSYLRDSQVKVIHLKRHNLLDRYLSLQLAQRSGKWMAYNKSKAGDANEPIRLDPEKCFKDFHRTEWFEEETNDFFKDNPKIEIIYEELAARPARECRRLLAFLGLEYQALSSPSIKQQTKRQSEIIGNYENLKKIANRGVIKGWAREEWTGFFKD